ncbi:MAG: TIR domain-containing protein [Bacteroidaceae bacterium]|nr:TIR domain-containing protein [Bacteroidaceae bacterium]
MKAKKYDIFISYRRSSYDTANLIATRLKSAGYTVFFDMETLRSGMFNEQLFNVIGTCTDFLLVLPPGALDRCVNEDDWVRLEVLHAMKSKKNIIPVMLNGFQWPETMPQGLEELCYYNALTASSVEYFDLSMERLQNRYLLSKRNFLYHKFVKSISVCVVSLLVLIAILWGVFMFISKDVCTNYATRMVSAAQIVHLMASDNAEVKNKWSEFENAYNYEAPDVTLRRAKEDLLEEVNAVEQNVAKSMSLVDSVQMDIGPFHSFLLSLNGINSEEIAISPMYARLMLEDYLSCLDVVRRAATEPKYLNISAASMYLESTEHSLNAYYASLIAELSNFPESSLKIYEESSRKWIHFPSHYKFGESEEYYMDIATKEMQHAEDALKGFKTDLRQGEAELNDFFRDNNTPGQLNDMIKEMDSQLVQLYDAVKAECSFTKEDGQWAKWNKCRMMGGFVNMIKNEQQSLYDEGYDFRLTVTPEQAYDDTRQLLDEYVDEYPESRAYVESAKAFYGGIVDNTCDYHGVMVYAIKDDITHPSLKVGDIIFEFDGKDIRSRDDLKEAYSRNIDGEMRVYRLFDGVLKIKGIGKLTDSDIVGFLDIIEPFYDKDVDESI